jgi:hypothetical protein
MQHGLNKPLNHKQIALLGRGFTPTSIGITGQQIKRMGRESPHQHTNRKTGRGRFVQYIPEVLRDEKRKPILSADGSKTYTGRFKAVWHKVLHLV